MEQEKNKKFWEEAAAKLNHEEFDENIISDNPAEFSEIGEVDALMKKNRQTLSGIRKMDIQKAWQKLRSRKNKEKRIAVIRSVANYAAIFLLLITCGYLFYKQYAPTKVEHETASTVFSIPNAEMGNVTLADGTKVFLNSGSELIYSSFSPSSREVYLKGEAYFEVKTDKKNPFFVHLHDFTIKVTGTKFNVISYPNENAETTLLEGHISILNRKGAEILKVKPNETMVFEKKANRIVVSNTNALAKIEWRNGEIHLKNKTMEEISRVLERWYNVKFIFEDESIKQVRLTGTILKSKPIEQIMEVLKLSEPLEFDFKYENQRLSTVKIDYKNKHHPAG